MEVKKILFPLLLVWSSLSVAEGEYVPLYPEDLFEYATEELKRDMRAEEEQHRAQWKSPQEEKIEAEKKYIAEKEAKKQASDALVISMEHARKEREERRSKVKSERATRKKEELESCAYYKEKLWTYEDGRNTRMQVYNGETDEITVIDGDRVTEMLDDFYLKMRKTCDYDNWYRPYWRRYDDWKEDRRKARKGKKYIK